VLQPPKWRQPKPGATSPSLSTGDLLRILRCELWAPQLSPESFCHFTSPPTPETNTQKPVPNLPPALFAAA
jgi:hypothetical protein